ncbi:MAG: pilus assembly protein PilP [Zoogloeaceae bacterium]|jgi:Tfp pilus assembly protein PilP|nr:pilus assembly protein PilP [Zoogloeaceae bacterium]
MRLQKIIMPLCALTLFFGVNINSYAQGYRYTLEQFEFDDLLLSGIRWSDGKWQACFMVYPGIYVVATKGQGVGTSVNQGLVWIKEIEKFHVVVHEIIESENGEWVEEERIVYLLNGPFLYDGEYGCNWDNSIMNYIF